MIGIIYYAFKMPIHNIYITGNKILSDNVIMNDSKLVNYPSFLLTSSREIEANIKNNNYVNKVKVKKKLGNVIDIHIVEYKVVAMVEEDSRLILSSGRIVDNIYDVRDVPILNNSVTEDVFEEFVKKFGEVNDNILRQVSQIEYSPVTVDNARFLLYMDDGNLVYITLTKINKLNKYNDIKDKMSKRTGTIYLDSGDYIEFNSASSNDNSNSGNDNISKDDASDLNDTDTTSNNDNNNGDINQGDNTLNNDNNISDRNGG